jgi:hypothetical protein
MPGRLDLLIRCSLSGMPEGDLGQDAMGPARQVPGPFAHPPEQAGEQQQPDKSGVEQQPAEPSTQLCVCVVEFRSLTRPAAASHPA